MITWLDLRRMTFDVGKRFTLRIKTTFYLLFGVMMIEGFFLFARAFGYIEMKNVFKSHHWMIFMAHFIFSKFIHQLI